MSEESFEDVFRKQINELEEELKFGEKKKPNKEEEEGEENDDGENNNFY